MRFEHDIYDIDVYSLCESVYYSCNNDEYDYVLECVNNWIYNDYNDNLLLEDIVLNEAISDDRLQTLIKKKFHQLFPGEDFQKSKDTSSKLPYSHPIRQFFAYARDLSSVNFEQNKKNLLKFHPDSKKIYSNIFVSKRVNELSPEEREHWITDLDTFQRVRWIGARENYRKLVRNRQAAAIDQSGRKVETNTQPTPQPKKEPSSTPLEDNKGRTIKKLGTGFKGRKVKPAQTSPKQDTPPPPPKQEPPKSNPILLNAQKKKDESQANMQKIVDNISQTSQQQEPPLKPGTAATDQPGRKVETNTQQQETPPKQKKPSQTPPKSNTPVVASNGNTPSRLSRATTWMKNNKVKGGLGVVAAGAAIGGSIYAYKRFKNRPKSVIAKRIQALRGIYHKFMINAQRNPQKANLFKRIAAKILSVIDKLLHYLQNKADGR